MAYLKPSSRLGATFTLFSWLILSCPLRKQASRKKLRQSYKLQEGQCLNTQRSIIWLSSSLHAFSPLLHLPERVGNSLKLCWSNSFCRKAHAQECSFRTFLELTQNLDFGEVEEIKKSLKKITEKSRISLKREITEFFKELLFR